MNKLVELTEQFHISLTEQQLEQFQLYYEMLVEKNKVMNLTAITEKEEVILKHFADSIALAKVFPKLKMEQLLDHSESTDGSNKEGTSVLQDIALIDVGTGAGFPGIPLKIAFPKLRVVLLDSLNKRVKFLNEVIDALGLENIEAVHSRAEDGARDKEYREQFDLCVSRAVANLATLSEYCIPYVAKGGYFVSYKSGSIEEEVNQGKKAVKTLGGKIIDVDGFQLSSNVGLENVVIDRSFVIIQKEKETPKAYPRKAGTASKSPL